MLIAATSEIVQVPLWLDLLAVFAGAVLGAAFAVRRGFDIAGVFAVLIVLSAIGLVMHGVTRVAARRYIFWIRRNEAPVLV